MKWILNLLAAVGDYLRTDDDDWLEELFSSRA